MQTLFVAITGQTTYADVMITTASWHFEMQEDGKEKFTSEGMTYSTQNLKKVCGYKERYV